jgi:DNA-binding NtrC family response regulator
LKPVLKVPTHIFGRNILVVEDELLVAWDIEATLTAAGLNVMGPVSSVQSALDLIRSAKPDAAILDLNLRGELVTPVAQELRKLGVPFVLSTAYNHLRPAGDEVFAEVENIGKPLATSRLLEVLGEMLD